MPTPAYISAAHFVKGVKEAEAGINIESIEQNFSDEKMYVENKGGSRVGFVHNWNVENTISITGEINTTNLNAVLGVAFGVHEVVAGLISGYGVSAGNVYLDDIAISQNRGNLANATANLTRLPDITS